MQALNNRRAGFCSRMNKADGLAGGVQSTNLERATAVANRMRTGTVWINDYHLISPERPFGGYKQSGIGREMGEAGLDDRLARAVGPMGAFDPPLALVAGELLFPFDELATLTSPAAQDHVKNFLSAQYDVFRPPYAAQSIKVLRRCVFAGTVNGDARFLHDGRARDLAEAILWHGGEAESARERFRHMARDDRAAMLRFLQSL